MTECIQYFSDMCRVDQVAAVIMVFTLLLIGWAVGKTSAQKGENKNDSPER